MHLVCCCLLLLQDAIRLVGRAEPAVLSVLALATGFSVLLEPFSPSEDTAVHLGMVEMAGTTFSCPQSAMEQVREPSLASFFGTGCLECT